jgi:hypothetical protein
LDHHVESPFDNEFFQGSRVGEKGHGLGFGLGLAGSRARSVIPGSELEGPGVSPETFRGPRVGRLNNNKKADFVDPVGARDLVIEDQG